MYITNSKNIVLKTLIPNNINLLSLAKFLSKYSPANPIIASTAPVTPIVLPKTISRIIPKSNPNTTPSLFPTNKPINITRITNKFGIIPAILNHVKKFICRQYITTNSNKIIDIPLNFFNSSSSFVLLCSNYKYCL